jgi:hypothetical protein
MAKGTTLASLSAMHVAYMLEWMAMFSMLVAWGREQRKKDTLGKAMRWDGGLCLADITSRGPVTRWDTHSPTVGSE